MTMKLIDNLQLLRMGLLAIFFLISKIWLFFILTLCIIINIWINLWVRIEKLFLKFLGHAAYRLTLALAIFIGGIAFYEFVDISINSVMPA